MIQRSVNRYLRGLHQVVSIKFQVNRKTERWQRKSRTSQIVSLDNHTARRFSFVEREQRSTGGCFEYIVDTLARQRRTF